MITSKCYKLQVNRDNYFMPMENKSIFFLAVCFPFHQQLNVTEKAIKYVRLSHGYYIPVTESTDNSHREK